MVNRGNSSKMWEILKSNRKLIFNQDIVNQIKFDMIIDDKLSALNVGIVLRDLELLEVANSVFERIIETDANYACAYHEYSESLIRSDRHAEALCQARKAIELEPEVFRFVLQYGRLLAGAGDINHAQETLDKLVLNDQESRINVLITCQFVNYLRQFPRAMMEATISRISGGLDYYSDSVTAQAVLDAVRDEAPFSVVRLGDGEGAWMFMTNSDEAMYAELYRNNRASFLKDWFGADDLLESNQFFAFSTKIHKVLESADIVGIPDLSRIKHEYRLLSRRGIPSSVNIYRKLNIMRYNRNCRQRFTSNNIHMQLNSQGFFSELWKAGKHFGIITSYQDLPDMLRRQVGVEIQHQFFTPGDSRNFWIESGKRPLRQFPDVVEDLSLELSRLDLHGVVFLVAAGFVGKQYLPIIKQQGGIALDIGGVANNWARTMLANR